MRALRRSARVSPPASDDPCTARAPPPGPSPERRPTLSQNRTAPAPKKQGGPSQKPDPKLARRDRRAAERDQFRRTVAVTGRPWWRSPMVLLTGGAVLLGVVVVGFALLSAPKAATGELTAPIDPAPKATWDGRSLGSATAPAVLAIYSDFQCPACDTFATKTEPQLIKDYVSAGKLRIVYKDFAFIGQESDDAAVAARCAGDQGLFWPFHDYLFANQRGENKGTFSRDRLTQIARTVGVADEATFTACLGTQAPLDGVKAETAEGQAKGVQSTPTLFLGEQKIVGVPAYQTLAQAIDAVVAGSPAPAASASPSATP